LLAVPTASDIRRRHCIHAMAAFSFARPQSKCDWTRLHAIAFLTYDAQAHAIAQVIAGTVDDLLNVGDGPASNLLLQGFPHRT
jgi:hypothetical protein